MAGALVGFLLLSVFGSGLASQTYMKHPNNKEYMPGHSYDGNKLFIVKGGRIAVKGQYDTTNDRGIQVEHHGNVHVVKADVDNVEVEFSILVSEEDLNNKIRISSEKDNELITITLPKVWKGHASITTVTNIRIPRGKKLDMVDIDFPVSDINFNDVDAGIKELGIRAAIGDVAFGTTNLKADYLNIDLNVGTIRGIYTASKFSASTKVGGIDLNLFVVGKEAEVNTSVDSGTTLLHVSQSQGTNNIKSKHNAHNGSITVYYPNVWEGKVHAQTSIGRVGFSDQIQVTKQKSRVVQEDKEGVKGNGRSFLQVQTDIGEIVVALE